MADFTNAFNLVIANEGGYTNDPDDPGGETYKGLARNMHSNWPGWAIIDNMKLQSGFPANLDQNNQLQEMISDFYRETFWNKMNGDKIQVQDIANSIFDFGVNAGLATSVSMAQKIVGAQTDGILGPKSLEGINNFNTDHFLAAFTVAKISRYINIVKKRPTSRKFFYGWVCRALGEN